MLICSLRESDTASTQQQQGAGQQFFLQFITRYMHWGGELRCRVTTITRRWLDPGPTLAADLITGNCCCYVAPGGGVGSC